ncbi:hypothetical protein ACET3Z_004963 [Daucus carota]
MRYVRLFSYLSPFFEINRKIWLQVGQEQLCVLQEGSSHPLHLVIRSTFASADVANKSPLEGWTSRVNFCDKLHVPVRVATVEK